MDPIKDLYLTIKDNGLFVDENDFRNQVKKAPKDVYDSLSSTNLFVDFNDFQTQLGFKKKVGSNPSQPSPSQSPLTFQDLSRMSRQTPVSDSPSPTADIQTKAAATEKAQGNKSVVTVKEKHQQDVQAAKQKLNTTIQNSDPILTKMIREGRVAELEAGVAPGLDNFSNPALATARKDLFTKIPVTPEEVATQKDLAIKDQNIGREVIRRAAKKDGSVASSAYLVDAEARSAEDPSKINVILDNAKKIESGELRYNVRNGVLEKPENFIISGIRGFQERNKQIEDYKFLTETKNDDAIISQLDADMKDYDPDRPVPVAEGGAAQFSQMLGMEGIPIIKSVGAGVVTGMIPGAQAAVPYVAAAASSPEYFQRGYSTALRESYYELRRRGVEGREALETARKQAEAEGWLSAAEGAISAGIGARIGFKPTNIVNSPGLKNALKNIVKSTGNFIKENLPEGATDAAVAGALQIAKNVEAQDNGLNRDILDGVGENVSGELLFTLGVGSLTQAGRTILNPETYNTLRTFVARQPKEAVDAKIGELIIDGKITPKTAQEISKEVENARAADAKIPDEIKDEGVRAQIQTKIEERDGLKKKLATVDEVFHAPIKEQIKNIDAEILNLSTNATVQSQIQEGNQQSNIQEPARAEAGQPEVGQGEGTEREGTQPQTNAGDSNQGSSGAIVTLAPFFNTTVTGTQDASRLRQTPEYKAYVESIPKVAKELGLEVETVNETIGGFENAQGEKIVEISNKVFLKNATVDQAERFAAIMGTMTPETQEATIAARYVNQQEFENLPQTEAVEELTLEVGDLNEAIASLKKAGITDFTIDQDNATISFLDFSKGTDAEFDNKIANFVEDLAGKKIYYGENSRRPVQSRYISPERRAEVLTEIENDADGLQQGGPNIRSIIAQAKQRDEAFRNKGQEVKPKAVQDISNVASKLADKFKKISPNVSLVSDNYDGVTRQLLADNKITNADYNILRKAKGFLDANTNTVYLNPERFTADTPIHEFGHVWFGMLKQFNPELYQKGLSLAQNVNLGQAYAELNEDDAKEEYLVDLIGKKGAEILKDRSALAQWVKDVFNYIKNTLGLTGNFESITLDEFVKMAAEDVVSGGKVTGVKGEAVIDPKFKAQIEDQGLLDRLKSNNVESRVKSGTKVSTRTPSAKGAPENVHTSDSYIIDLKSARENPANYINNAIEVASYPVLGKVAKSDVAALNRGVVPKSKGGTEQDVKKAVKIADKIYDKFVRVVADNLMWLHDHFDQDLRDVSHRWYDGANVIAQDYASKYGVTEDQAAGVIAVLSPQMDWYKNVSLADRVLDIVKNKRQFVFDDKMSEKYVELAGKLQQGKNETDQEFEDRTVRSIEKAKTEVVDLLGKPLDASKEYFPRTLRTYDEVYNNKSYDILTPNGDPIGKAINKDGSLSSIGWQGYSTIAKAISIVEDGSVENISRQLGDMHKVRNFYNNISDPNSSTGDVTIDTHAVAAGLLKPLAGSDAEVIANLSGKSSAITGSTGTYAAFADAYRLAAKEKGILPRQMQSITWEAVRGLFKDTWKANKANKKKINDLWDDYLKGKTSIDETRKLIDEAAGGVETPSWARPGGSTVTETGTGDNTGELPASSTMGSESGSRRGTDGEREADMVQPTSSRLKLQDDEEALRAEGTGEEMERGLARRFDDLSNETYKKINDEAITYFQRTNKQTKEAVLDFMKGKETLDVADYVMSNPNIPDVSLVWMAAETAKKLTKEIEAARESKDQVLVQKLSDKQSEIYNEFSKKATSLGQAVQAFIAFADDPNAVQFSLNKIIRQLNEKGVTPTEDQINDIREKLRAVGQAKEGIPKDEAIVDLAHYLSGITPVRSVEILQAIWYAKILSGITTQTKNLLANMYNTFAETTVAATRESIRNMSLMPYVMAAKGLAGGFAKGAVVARDIFRTGLARKEEGKYFNENVLESFSWGRTKVGQLGGGVVGKVMDSPFLIGVSPRSLKLVGRALSASDAMFSTANQEAFSNMYAWLQASKEGKDAPTVSNYTRANEILGNTKENIAKAEATAKEEGYKPDTDRYRRRVIELVAQGRGKNMLNAAERFGAKVTLNYEPEGFIKPIYDQVIRLQQEMPVAKLWVPFTRIVANLSEMMLDYSPAGYAKALLGKKNPFQKDSSRLSPEERMDLVIKASMAMGALAIFAANTGEDDDDWFEITANGTGNAQKNYELQKEGWRPYTITLKDGTKINYADWPIRGIIAGIGAVRDGVKYGDQEGQNVEDMMRLYAIGYASTLYESSLMQGLADFIDIFQPRRGKYSGKPVFNEEGEQTGVDRVSYYKDGISKWSAQQAKSVLISNFTQQIFKLIDEAQGDPIKMAKGAQIIYRDIPIINDGLNPIIDVFGDEVSPTTSEKFFPFYKISDDKKNKMIEMLHDNKVFVGIPDNQNMITLKGNERPMTDDELYEFRKLAGKYTKEMIYQLMDERGEGQEITQIKTEAIVEAARAKAYAEVLQKSITK